MTYLVTRCTMLKPWAIITPTNLYSVQGTITLLYWIFVFYQIAIIVAAWFYDLQIFMVITSCKLLICQIEFCDRVKRAFFTSITLIFDECQEGWLSTSLASFTFCFLSQKAILAFKQYEEDHLNPWNNFTIK